MSASATPAAVAPPTPAAVAFPPPERGNLIVGWLQDRLAATGTKGFGPTLMRRIAALAPHTGAPADWGGALERDPALVALVALRARSMRGIEALIRRVFRSTGAREFSDGAFKERIRTIALAAFLLLRERPADERRFGESRFRMLQPTLDWAFVESIQKNNAVGVCLALFCIDPGAVDLGPINLEGLISRAVRCDGMQFLEGAWVEQREWGWDCDAEMEAGQVGGRHFNHMLEGAEAIGLTQVNEHET